MATWVENTPANASNEPLLGETVEVQLHGDSATYRGKCVKPRKLWVKLSDHPMRNFTADENSIARWRRVQEGA